MAQQQAAPTYTYTKENTIDVSIYPSAKREKHETQYSIIEPSAPTLNDLFPDINPTTISMFWYLTQTFPELKKLYDTYPTFMVLKCINIHPAIWNTFNFNRQKEYLDICADTEQYMKKHNI